MEKKQDVIVVDYTYWAKRCRELKHNTSRQPEVILEAQGPLGLSFLVRIMLEDAEANTARIEEIFVAYQGHIGRRVRWLFEEKGEILISKYRSKSTEDNIMLAALSLGAEDVEFGEWDVVRILCAAGKLETIAELLEFEDIEVYEKRLCYLPRDYFEVYEQSQIMLVIDLMNALLEQETVLDISADFLLNDVVCKQLGYEVY